MRNLLVYWWTLNGEDGKDNYGDILAPYIVNKLSGRNVKKVRHPMMRRYRYLFKHYVTIGSIISAASKNSIVWGSGIIRRDQNVREATFLAVRGPLTRERLLELGYKVPEIYGDPALILPTIFSNNVNKKFELGIIPHYVDYQKVLMLFNNDHRIKVIDLMTNDIEKTTEEILECRNIISSSLHGLIVPHAYLIPALWVKFSNNLSGDNVKFYDYFQSVGLNYDEVITCDENDYNYDNLLMLLNKHSIKAMPAKNILKMRTEQLLSSCPFKK